MLMMRSVVFLQGLDIVDEQFALHDMYLDFHNVFLLQSSLFNFYLLIMSPIEFDPLFPLHDRWEVEFI